jgi:serine protease
MQSRLFRAALLGLALASAAPAPASAQEVVPDRLLVKLKGTSAALIDAQIARISSETGLPLELERETILGWYVLSVRSEELPETVSLTMVADQLKTRPDVETVELDRLMKPFWNPNDYDASEQWGSDIMNLPEAWDTATGAGIIIAVVDTGVTNHPELQGKVLGGYDFVSDPWMANDGDGRDSDYTDPGDGADCGSGFFGSSWHGTSVGGIAAAVTDNGTGIAGAAPDASLTMVRVLGRCGGSLTDIYEGAYWAAGGTISGVPNNPHPADVINMSLGGQGQCETYAQDVIDAITASGRIIVVAAGNSAQDTAGFAPVSCSNVIGVGASAPDDYISDYSNWGDDIDILAPGGDMYWFGEAGGVLVPISTTDGSYKRTEGTSFSAPYVSGIVAQMLSVDPSLTRNEIVGQYLQPTGQDGYYWNGAETLLPWKIADAEAALDLLPGAVGDDDDATADDDDDDDTSVDDDDTSGDDDDTSGDDDDTSGDDTDGDGFASNQDCDDGNSSIYPGATEECDLVDSDCDGSLSEGCGSSGDDDDDHDISEQRYTFTLGCSMRAGRTGGGIGWALAFLAAVGLRRRRA